MKYISLDIEHKRELAERFGVTSVCVWMALTYKRNSEQAQAIRAAAIEMGGRVIRELDITDGFCPNCEARISLDGDGCVAGMTLLYPSGVRVEADDDNATLYVGGRAERKYWNVTLGNLYKVALEAQLLSESLSA